MYSTDKFVYNINIINLLRLLFITPPFKPYKYIIVNFIEFNIYWIFGAYFLIFDGANEYFMNFYFREY